MDSTLTVWTAFLSHFHASDSCFMRAPHQTLDRKTAGDGEHNTEKKGETRREEDKKLSSNEIRFHFNGPARSFFSLHCINVSLDDESKAPGRGATKTFMLEKVSRS